MKIRELIESLSKLPQDQLIFVEGYEGGYSEIVISETKKLTLNVNKQYYLGPHDEVHDSKTPAVILLRKPNQ